MKTDRSVYRSPNVFFVIGLVSFLSPLCAGAWTIQILDPVQRLTSEEHNLLPGGSSVSKLKGYLDATGSMLTTGSLGSYAIGDSDAVIVNVSVGGYSYNQAELNALSNLLNSNTRVLVFGEHSSWANTNSQLATLLGGSYTGSGSNNQSVISDYCPLITEGVYNVRFGSPGRVSPNGSSGHALVSDNSMSLWGNADNFLLFLDINALSSSYINNDDNDRLARNIATWLGGTGFTPIPEPSSYAGLLGITAVTSVLVRRKRK